MYNIKNPIHYIAANNPEGTIEILTRNGLAEPKSWEELVTSVDFAYQQFGQPFVEAMSAIHPDKQQILVVSGLQRYSNRLGGAFSNMIEDTYKIEVEKYSNSQLTQEIESLNQQLLTVGTDEAKRTDILEKIKYLQEVQLKKLSDPRIPASADAQGKMSKINHCLLLGLTAFALMYLGSKIIKS